MILDLTERDRHDPGGAPSPAMWHQGTWLAGLAALFAVVAAIAFAIYHRTAAVRGHPHKERLTIALPKVEPLLIAPIPVDEARSINARTPIRTELVEVASPYRFSGSVAERERALVCLAAAVWYEAGDDPLGEQAVAQVVLNRLRHPAFPKTICGTVFQGSERTTGCQFSFTCDGSLRRVPSALAWRRARDIASAALAGFVMRDVGTATHYHTDWVLPYWSAALDKIARVHTHLFFRWHGPWGRRGAFVGTHSGPEIVDSRLVQWLDTAGSPVATIDSPVLLPDDAVYAGTDSASATVDRDATPQIVRGSKVRLADHDNGQFVLELDPHVPPGDYAMAAITLCGSKDACTVVGWLSDRMPEQPAVAVRDFRTGSFVYVRKHLQAPEFVFWNCHEIARADVSQCLPGTAPR